MDDGKALPCTTQGENPAKKPLFQKANIDKKNGFLER